MTKTELRKIIRERLDRWADKLVAAHATPAALVAIGHDDQRGTSFVLTLEDLDDRSLGILLSSAGARVRGSAYASDFMHRVP